jgi:hypothetical protein
MRGLSLAGLLCVALCGSALAQSNGSTPIATPAIGVTETGENSQNARMIMSMARLKLGYCTATTAGSEGAQTATCNAAAGQITGGFNTTVTSGSKDIVTVTNSKVLATDSCQATIDDTGAAAGSTPLVSACRVSAGQLILVVTNITATSPAAALKYYFTLLTGGDPN